MIVFLHSIIILILSTISFCPPSFSPSLPPSFSSSLTASLSLHPSLTLTPSLLTLPPPSLPSLPFFLSRRSCSPVLRPSQLWAGQKRKREESCKACTAMHITYIVHVNVHVHVYTCMKSTYMRISANYMYNSLGCKQPSGLVTQYM